MQYWAFQPESAKNIRGVDASISAVTVLASLLSAFERQVLIGTALHTDGSCYCVADCGMAIKHQFDSKSLLMSPAPVLFVLFFLISFLSYSLKVIILDTDIFSKCNLLFLFLCKTDWTNTSNSMISKFILCLRSLCSTSKLSMG